MNLEQGWAGYTRVITSMFPNNFWAYSNRSQSWDIFVEGELSDRVPELSIPESKVSHWVVTLTALLLLIKGLEFLAFRESNLSTMVCTRRTYQWRETCFSPSMVISAIVVQNIGLSILHLQNKSAFKFKQYMKKWCNLLHMITKMDSEKHTT